MPVGQDVAERAGKHFLRIGALLGRRFPHAGVHGRAIGPAGGWLLSETRQVVDNRVDHRIAEAAHLICGQLQGRRADLLVNFCVRSQWLGGGHWIAFYRSP